MRDERRSTTCQSFTGLQRAKGCFVPWLQKYHAVVEKTEAASSESSLPGVLLTGCGAELFKSQKGLADVVDAYVDEIEQRSP